MKCGQVDTKYDHSGGHFRPSNSVSMSHNAVWSLINFSSWWKIIMHLQSALWFCLCFIEKVRYESAWLTLNDTLWCFFCMKLAPNCLQLVASMQHHLSFAGVIGGQFTRCLLISSMNFMNLILDQWHIELHAVNMNTQKSTKTNAEWPSNHFIHSSCHLIHCSAAYYHCRDRRNAPIITHWVDTGL